MSYGQKSMLDGAKKWRENNPEKAKENSRRRGKIYYKKNKSKILNRTRERREYMKEDAACEIINKHHEDMKDDPERLTTEFMKSIVNVKCEDYDA